MTYEHPELLKLLIEVSWMDREPWSQRASRVASICFLRFPELFKPFCTEVIKKLGAVRSEGVVRNFTKTLAEVAVTFNKRDKSILLNLCFDYLSGEYTVSVKVFSMQILYNLSLETPEIGIELSHVIEENIPFSSPGYRSRGEKILKKLQRSSFR